MTKRLAAALFVLCWLWVFASAWREPRAYQFDFKTYYIASQVASVGQSPYNVHNLRAAGGNPHILPFCYPLATLSLCQPLSQLDYPVAHRVWLGIKAAALALLFLLWRRRFLTPIDWWVLLGASLLAFQAAVVWDVKVGNITVLEQLCLWTGFAFLLKKRTTMFVFFTVLASIAKLVPIAFLVLLFIPALRSRGNTIRAVAGVAALAVITVLPFASAPHLWPQYIHAVVSQHPPLQANPSVIGVLDELARLPDTQFLAVPWIKWTMLAAYYALLFLVSRRLVARSLASGSVERCIYVAVFLYALAAPRLIIYSYAIVIVPALAMLLPLAGNQRVGVYALLAAMCLGGLPILPTAAGKFISDVSPWLLLWGIWLTLTVLDRAAERAEATPTELVPNARLYPTHS